jgi:hypothetical protein
MLFKILGLLISRQISYADKVLTGSLLAGMAVLFMLGLLASILLSICIGITLYISYTALLAAGLMPLQAAFIVNAELLFVTIAVVAVAVYYIKKIKSVPKRLFQIEVQTVEQINKAINAFTHGFNAGFNAAPRSK